MLSVTTSEARRNLADVIRQVRKGKRVILKAHDRPVSAVISIADLRRLRALERQNELLIARAAAHEAEEIPWEDLKADLESATHG